MNRILRALRLLPVAVGWGLALRVFAGVPATPEPAKAVPPQLAALRARVDPHALDVAWPYLDSPDCTLREAARLAVEAQPFATWKQRALDEKNTWASLEALRALVEACPKTETAALSPHLCEQITTLRIDEMNEAQQLATLQLTRSVFARLGPVSADERNQMLDLWSHFAGPRTARAKAEVTRLVDFLEKASAVE